MGRQLPGLRPLKTGEREEIQRALRAMIEIVTMAGDDFIYEPKPDPRDFTSCRFGFENHVCLYVYGDQPDCLIGRVLHRMGHTVESLSQWEYQSVELMAVSSNAIIGIPISRVLLVAQTVQDTGKNWGDARDAALLAAYTGYGVKVNP